MKNYTLTERARYFPETFSRDEIAELMEELDLWRANNYGTPEECAAMVRELKDSQENPDHANYDDLKSFFDDTVQNWEETLASGRWPCAEPYDDNLRAAMFDDMQKGADAIRMIDGFLSGENSREDMLEFYKGLTSC